MDDESTIAYDACAEHMRKEHEDYGTPNSCGVWCYACLFCDWQIFVEISGGDA